MGRLPSKSPELKDKPVKTADIEVAVARMFNIRTHIIIPNLSWGFHFGHEMDLFVLSSSNYGKEVEIKISVSDFRADFKKSHNHHSKYVREFYYAFPRELYNKVKDEVPEHAGIIVCDRNSISGNVRATIEKKAVINNKSVKLTDGDIIKLGRLGIMRIWSLKEAILIQKRNNDELKQIINDLKNDTKVS